jgi:hypothetical protein
VTSQGKAAVLEQRQQGVVTVILGVWCGVKDARLPIQQAALQSMRAELPFAKIPNPIIRVREKVNIFLIMV